MRKHVIAAATATMFCIATGTIVAGIGGAVAAETGTKTFPTSSVNPPPTPPPVWGDEPRGHYVYPRCTIPGTTTIITTATCQAASAVTTTGS
jgi:hypothetical protein